MGAARLLTEYDCFVAVQQNAVFQVVAQAACQNGFFNVFARAHQVFHGVGVVDTDNVLLDDGALV